MDMPDPNDLEPTPPTPERVAARALVLAGVSCRGLIEKDAGKPGADQLRQRVCQWLQDLGIADEIETSELDLLTTPLGQLNQQSKLYAGWRSEGMLVLGWALRLEKLLPFYTECQPNDVANRLGFLGKREETPLYKPRLRDSDEIEHWADTYLTAHWRLREFSRTPENIDFEAYVARCDWGSLTLTDVTIPRQSRGL